MDLPRPSDQFVLSADLPGLGEDDVKIELVDRVLTISGERKAEHETTQAGYRRVERAFGSFSRSLTLPQGVDAEAISASFDRGVLEVRIPKPEQRKPRTISIAPRRRSRPIGPPTLDRRAAGAALVWPPPCSPSAPETRAPTPAPAR